jgi:hypothetical protein
MSNNYRNASRRLDHINSFPEEMPKTLPAQRRNIRRGMKANRVRYQTFKN